MLSWHWWKFGCTFSLAFTSTSTLTLSGTCGPLECQLGPQNERITRAINAQPMALSFPRFPKRSSKWLDKPKWSKTRAIFNLLTLLLLLYFSTSTRAKKRLTRNLSQILVGPKPNRKRTPAKAKSKLARVSFTLAPKSTL